MYFYDMCKFFHKNILFLIVFFTFYKKTIIYCSFFPQNLHCYHFNTFLVRLLGN